MNRSWRSWSTRKSTVPRTRGDEPLYCREYLVDRNPFPARAGMNRPGQEIDKEPSPVPRTRGDEPHSPSIGVQPMNRSPHARG